MRKIFTLLIVAILATATSWAATTGTIKFGTNNVKIDKASVTAADDQGNSWKITTAGTTSFSQQPTYSQVGKQKESAKTITFTTTLSKDVKVTSLSAKFGGFNGTAGTIKLSVGSTEIGTGSLSETKDVTVTSTSEASGTQLTVKVENIAKGVKCYNISYTYEDESGKTPTQLSWSAPTATVDLASEVKEFPTLTKKPESITGITYSSSNADVATVNEATGEITIVACGQTTIKAAYAGDDTYASSSATYTLRVVDNSIAAGEYTFPINNWFWATNYTGSFNVEKGSLKLQGQQNGISISLGNVNSTNAYVNDNETRTYRSYMMTVNAPEGYVLKKIEFVGTTWQSSTLNASAGNMGAQKIWSGNVSSVEFYFAGTCEIKNVKIAYEKAAPAKTLTSIAITGEPAQTEYTEGETFSAEGLVVTATYDDASTAVVTADATWTFDPATLAVGTTSVTATATYNEKTASETYNVTVKEIPSYTYTWMVNGAEVKKSVLKEGAAVEAPANPENIADKVFTGWVTTATVDANVAPTYATIDATAKANTTYYAVFATLKQGAGEKWVKKAASEITEEGVYALIIPDNNAFNGTIESGHGKSTASTFVFDKNNEANSAPEGTCELTFVKNGDGYQMLNKATGQYLYSKAAEKGNLAWNQTEDSYWYFYDDNWVYKKNTTYLRTYKANKEFRTYGVNNANNPVYFAQKVSGAGYADFTTIVKAAEVTTLANLAENGAEGAAYQVNDVMVVAKKFQRNNKNYIVVKDAAEAVRNFSTPAADDKFFNINGNKQEEYAQNNWMLVSLPVELYNQVNEKSTVTSITGTLTEKLNVAMEATNVVFENVTNDDFAPNTYCAINFMGASSVNGNNPAYTSSYYFAIPKANEYANVVWAVYNATDGAFYLPTHQGVANAQEFKAAFKVDYSLNSSATPALTNGNVYSFEALVKEVAVATTDAKSAPRKVAYDSTVTPSTKFVVYPLDLDADKVATGVNDVNCAKEVKGVSYFNMMGVESAQPFDGVNIMVTTYTDGTSSATKVLR